MLSGNDEILLLAVSALKDGAYGATLMKELSRLTGREWSIGAIYDPLYRLERQGLVKSEMATLGASRGARSRRIYSLTQKGRDALAQHDALRSALLVGFDSSVSPV